MYKRKTRLLCMMMVLMMLATGCGKGGAEEQNVQPAQSDEQVKEAGEQQTGNEEAENEDNVKQALEELEAEEQALLPAEISMVDNYRTYYE